VYVITQYFAFHRLLKQSLQKLTKKINATQHLKNDSAFLQHLKKQ